MRTPFTEAHAAFARRAARWAAEHHYPAFARDVLGDRPLGFVDMERTQADYARGVDRIMRLATGEITLAERFRRGKYRRFREITATLSNDASGRLGDFHRLDADFYVYAYYPTHLYVADVDRLLAYDGPRSYFYYRQKQQRCVGFPIDELLRRGVIVYAFEDGQRTR